MSVIIHNSKKVLPLQKKDLWIFLVSAPTLQANQLVALTLRANATKQVSSARSAAHNTLLDKKPLAFECKNCSHRTSLRSGTVMQGYWTMSYYGYATNK